MGCADSPLLMTVIPSLGRRSWMRCRSIPAQDCRSSVMLSPNHEDLLPGRDRDRVNQFGDLRVVAQQVSSDTAGSVGVGGALSVVLLLG